ncbi:AcrR family transcriptional regulator [Saccharothrix tamanrassetensis]|uniref:AcrR family transcriptional regulator n=1 Tax=Saccharothrix tamanrassetensis TaxID=1051531 RepID=A0A841CPP5_9PSEU|nr:TetR/AcrR family transcriptional regulator [Saccharothrix tamanrassetensis]MBB5959170.1 AcrR family transcriptional regulator [Saccharothrix tamanrassetensis]
MRSDRQQAVLDAALALVEAGQPVTISNLTARSGVSNGSIYHHFGSRAGVFEVLYGDSFARCVAAMTPALAAGDTEKVVRDLAVRYLDWVAGNPGRARFLYDAPLTADPAAKAAAFAPIARWFTERVADGSVREFPLWALDPVVMGPAHECARRYLLGVLDLAGARDAVADAVWGTVAPLG